VPRDWDHYYADPAHADLIPAPLLVHVADLLPPGNALDLACGPGRHALHLAKLGWRVTAVDSSAAALRILRSQAAGLREVLIATVVIETSAQAATQRNIARG